MFTKAAVLTLLAMAVSGLVAILISKTGKETPMLQAVENRDKPPIDRRAPENVKTVTFGLG